jgi:hypothetical protein
MKRPKNKRHRWIAGILTTACILLFGVVSKELKGQQSQTPARTPHAVPAFTPVPGTGNLIYETTLFIEPLPALDSSLRIRMITIPSREAELPTASEMLLEVRSGELITLSNGVQTERHPGDMWLVSKGAAFRVKAVSEFSVVRAIDLVHTAK